MIQTKDDLTREIKALIQIEPLFQNAYQHTDLIQVRKREQGFLALAHVLVSQQLSVAAAESIWNNLINAQLIDEESYLNASDEFLRSNGLSKQKIRYLKSLASEKIGYPELCNKDNETVKKILTSVTGIGNWTAEIYLIFSLQRCDVFASNDLALQEAYKRLFSINQRPNEKEMREAAMKWQPHRSAAAILLWHYYRMTLNRKGINQ